MRTRPLLAFLLLAACNSDPENGPGGVTPEEAQALNDAAEMLDNDAMATSAANLARPETR